MWLHSEHNDENGHHKLFFEGRLTKCRACPLKQDCLPNRASPNTRKGHSRQVSFIVQRATQKPRYTDWMKQRMDSAQGKPIYSQRMSVVDPSLPTSAATRDSNASAYAADARSRDNGNGIV